MPSRPTPLLRLLILLSACQLVSVSAFSEFRPIVYTESPVFLDTLEGLTPDTLTFAKSQRADLLYITITPDSIATTPATDSLTVHYRCFGKNATDAILRGAATTEALDITGLTGTAVALTNWLPGATYHIVLDPLPGQFQQLILTGSAGDTFPYRLEVEEVNNQ